MSVPPSAYTGHAQGRDILTSWGTDTLLSAPSRADNSVAAWVGVLAAWLAALKRDSLAVWRKPLGYLALSILVWTLLISWIKSLSNMDCPWDIEGLGGVRPYVELFATRPAGLPDDRCFPAGHASGGYAWMSLYFFCLLIRPRLRWLGLAAGLGAGVVFGIGQQLRGAHFPSHDLWTTMLCWLVAFGLYRLLLRGSAVIACASRAIGSGTATRP